MDSPSFRFGTLKRGDNAEGSPNVQGLLNNTTVNSPDLEWIRAQPEESYAMNDVDHVLLEPVEGAKLKEETTTIPAAIFNLSNTILGAGMMALPYAFSELGIVGGTLGIALVALLTQHCCSLLVRASRITCDQTFNDLCTTVLGPRSQQILQGCIICNNLGLLVAYLDIMGDCLHGEPDARGLGPLWLDGTVPSFWLSREILVALMLIVFILPFALKRNLDDFKITSFFAMLFAFNFVITTVVLAIILGAQGKLNNPRWFPDEFKMDKVIGSVPVFTTAFVCQYNLHPLMHELAEPRHDNMTIVTKYSLIITSLIYVAVGSCAFILFENDIETDVLKNFDEGLNIANPKYLTSVLKFGYVLTLAFSFPVISFSLRQNISLLLPSPLRIYGTELSESARFNGISLGVMLGAYALCMCIPDIYTAFQLTGSTVGLIIGFVLPSAVDARQCMQEGNFGRLLFTAGIFWGGIVIGILAFILALIGLF